MFWVYLLTVGQSLYHSNFWILFDFNLTVGMSKETFIGTWQTDEE